LLAKNICGVNTNSKLYGKRIRKKKLHNFSIIFYFILKYLVSKLKFKFNIWDPDLAS
jgi:hypothetical protein